MCEHVCVYVRVCMVSKILRARDQVERILAVGRGAAQRKGRVHLWCVPSVSEESARGLHVSGAPCGEGSRHTCF